MYNGEIQNLNRLSSSQRKNLLCKSAAEGDLKQCQYLIKAGVSPNTYNPIWQTPLIAASRFGKKKMIRFLLKAGADIDGRDQHSNTPLICAAHEGNLLTVFLLLSQGANPNLKRIDNLDAMTLGGCGHLAGLLKLHNKTLLKVNPDVCFDGILNSKDF